MCGSSFQRNRDYDLVKYPSKDVSSCPVVGHQLKQVIVNAWDGYADAWEACEPLSTIPNGPNHTNSLQYKSSSVRYVHMDPERALLFPNANSSGIFHETCHHEKSPFLGTVAWSQSQSQKHNSCLFLPHHSDPAKALYTTVSHLRAADLHRKTDSSQKDTIRWP